MAEWLRSGLQSRLHRFDSGRRLSGVWASGRAFTSWRTNGAPPPGRPGVLALLRGWQRGPRAGAARSGPFEREPVVHGIAQLQPGTERRGAVDRLRRAGRTVPWASWYELTTGSGFGNEQRLRQPVRQHGRCQPGQVDLRGPGPRAGRRHRARSFAEHPHRPATPRTRRWPAARPSIRPNRGRGSPGRRRPRSPVSGKDQIFVERPIGPGSVNCDGVKPAGVLVAGHVPSIGGFCWQQIGIPHVGPGAADPSLNVDPTRNGVEPDITFTGSQRQRSVGRVV